MALKQQSRVTFWPNLNDIPSDKQDGPTRHLYLFESWM